MKVVSFTKMINEFPIENFNDVCNLKSCYDNPRPLMWYYYANRDASGYYSIYANIYKQIRNRLSSEVYPDNVKNKYITMSYIHDDNLMVVAFDDNYDNDAKYRAKCYVKCYKVPIDQATNEASTEVINYFIDKLFTDFEKDNMVSFYSPELNRQRRLYQAPRGYDAQQYKYNTLLAYYLMNGYDLETLIDKSSIDIDCDINDPNDAYKLYEVYMVKPERKSKILGSTKTYYGWANNIKTADLDIYHDLQPAINDSRSSKIVYDYLYILRDCTILDLAIKSITVFDKINQFALDKRRYGMSESYSYIIYEESKNILKFLEYYIFKKPHDSDSICVTMDMLYNPSHVFNDIDLKNFKQVDIFLD